MIVTKDEMCAKAIQLIRQNGYSQVSIPMICQACGVTKGSFYHHFKSKEDLILYWISWHMGNSIHIPQDKDLSPKETLRQMLYENARLIETIGCDIYFNAIVADAQNGGAGLLENVTHTPDILQLLEKAIELGEIHWDGPASYLLGSYVAVAMGALVKWKMQDGKEDIVTDLENQFNIIFR